MTTPRSATFELRTYTAYDGRLPALMSRFRDHTTKLFERHGIRNVGYWVPQEAPTSQNTLIYILAHTSREAAANSWDAFHKDPEWQKVQKDSEANGKLVIKIKSVFMDPLDFSLIK